MKINLTVTLNTITAIIIFVWAKLLFDERDNSLMVFTLGFIFIPMLYILIGWCILPYFNNQKKPHRAILTLIIIISLELCIGVGALLANVAKTIHG